MDTNKIEKKYDNKIYGEGDNDFIFGLNKSRQKLDWIIEYTSITWENMRDVLLRTHNLFTDKDSEKLLDEFKDDNIKNNRSALNKAIFTLYLKGIIASISDLSDYLEKYTDTQRRDNDEIISDDEKSIMIKYECSVIILIKGLVKSLTEKHDLSSDKFQLFHDIFIISEDERDIIITWINKINESFFNNMHIMLLYIAKKSSTSYFEAFFRIYYLLISDIKLIATRSIPSVIIDGNGAEPKDSYKNKYHFYHNLLVDYDFCLRIVKENIFFASNNKDIYKKEFQFKK